MHAASTYLHLIDKEPQSARAIRRPVNSGPESATRSRLDALVAAHFVDVHRLLQRLVASRADADDLAQETFVRVMRGTSTALEQNPAGYLRRVALNLAADHHRRRGVRSLRSVGADPDAADPDQQPSPSDGDPRALAADSEFRSALAREVLALPDNLRASFAARVLEQRTYEEAAELLGIQSGTVRTHVMHARRQLEQRLASFMELDE